MASKEKKRRAPEDETAREEWARRFKAHPVLFVGTIITLVIVIVAFVLVPAMAPGADGPAVDLNFGSYNKVPITYVQGGYFARAQSSIAQSRQSQITDGNYQTTLYQIWRDAFEETVRHMGVLDETAAAGYIPPQKEVDRAVALLDAFQENGRFSVIKYRALDDSTRITLWRQVQENLQEERFSADQSGLKTASGEAAFIAGMASPQRSFGLASFPISSYPEPELAAYGEGKKDLFRTAHLSVITVTSNEKEAAKLLDQVKNGDVTFEETAIASSKDDYADKNGDMGLKMAHELASEIPDETEREGVLALAKGELSPVVKVPQGWAFFRAEEDVKQADFEDSATLAKVRAYLLDFERSRAEDWLIGEAAAFAASVRELGFDEACGEKGVTAKSFGPLPVNYGSSNFFTGLSSTGVGEIYQAASNEHFWRACFNGPVGEPSEPLVLGDNVVVLFPREEKQAEESETSAIESYYSYMVSSASDTSVRNYFLSNPKLEDKFTDTFFKYLWGD